MSKRKRRKFSDEFKADSVKLITEQGYSIAEAARNLGVNANQLSRWKREIENPSEKSSRSDNMTAMQAELKRLRKENKQLKMEREILKKAAACVL
ncbi:transposase [Desulfogranum marinum]|uniref:transposase n=1 Tax=Desulfogranum marinum TaxID=453220 RepID=UPI0029C72C0E|nr:transposase [Desulfogranum marinum]